MPGKGWGYDQIPPPSMAEAQYLAANWRPEWTIGMVMSESSRLWAIDVDDTAEWERWQQGNGQVRERARSSAPRAACTWSTSAPKTGTCPRCSAPPRSRRAGISPSRRLSARTAAGISGWTAARSRATCRTGWPARGPPRRWTAAWASWRSSRRRGCCWPRGSSASRPCLEFPGTLADSLERPRPEQRYLIEGLWGAAHNLSIEAMYKTGKSTLLASAAGSLADGTPFLGFVPVHPPAGTVAVWNCEMDPDDFDDYLLPHVTDRSRIIPAHLRWRPVPLLTSKKDRDMTVAWLRFHSAQAWIIDSWTRLCAWNNIDPIDNAAVGRLTAYLDEIKHEAGVTALAVTAHMPHAARQDRTFERGLGAQAFSGWVDCMWRYVRDESGNRFLSAEGRKVHLEECQVFMDGSGRLVAVAGDRDGAAGQTLEYALLTSIRMHPGRSTAQVCKVGKRKEDAEAALRELERLGQVATKPGFRGAVYGTRHEQAGRYLPHLRPVPSCSDLFPTCSATCSPPVPRCSGDLFPLLYGNRSAGTGRRGR